MVEMNMMPSAAMRKLEDDMSCAVQFDGRVMISGERGTGKKFVAQLIHKRSHRRTAPFVIANREDFAELPPEPSSLPESAHPFKNGLLKTAHNGTLLIDGIDKLTVAMQLQLLRLIESEMTSGGDVRLMSTMTTDVFERVRTVDFREELFYRLNIIHLTMPALRDRPEDIPILFQHYLSHYANTDVPRLSPAALQRLVEYAWPGNIHELKGVAEGLSRQNLPRQVEPDDLPAQIYG
jgi:two-component system, NtrC family, response regulator AtoC